MFPLSTHLIHHNKKKDGGDMRAGNVSVKSGNAAYFLSIFYFTYAFCFGVCSVRYSVPFLHILFLFVAFLRNLDKPEWLL